MWQPYLTANSPLKIPQEDLQTHVVETSLQEGWHALPFFPWLLARWNCHKTIHSNKPLMIRGWTIKAHISNIVSGILEVYSCRLERLLSPNNAAFIYLLWLHELDPRKVEHWHCYNWCQWESWENASSAWILSYIHQLLKCWGPVALSINFQANLAGMKASVIIYDKESESHRWILNCYAFLNPLRSTEWYNSA